MVSVAPVSFLIGMAEGDDDRGQADNRGVSVGRNREAGAHALFGIFRFAGQGRVVALAGPARLARQYIQLPQVLQRWQVTGLQRQRRFKRQARTFRVVAGQLDPAFQVFNALST